MRLTVSGMGGVGGSGDAGARRTGARPVSRQSLTGTPAHRHTGTPAHRHTGTPYASPPNFSRAREAAR